MLSIRCPDCLLSHEIDGLEKMDLDVVTRLAVHYQIWSQSVMGNKTGNLEYGGRMSYSMAILFNARSYQAPPGRSVELLYIRWTVEPRCSCHQRQNIPYTTGPLTRADMCNIVRCSYDCGCTKPEESFCHVRCNSASTWETHRVGWCGKFLARYWATDATSQNHETATNASVSRRLHKAIYYAKTAPGV
jgi:hypothetical protein